MTTYKSLLREVRTLKKVASADLKEKLLSLLNSGKMDQINQALVLNESLGILSEKEIGQVLAPMVIKGKVNIKEQWKQGGLGWFLLETIPNHPMWNNLRELYLSYLHLTSIPSSLGNLKNLKVLYLDGNLSSIPKEIGNLKNLKVLNLTNNSLGSLPSSIGNLTNLEELHSSMNKLTSLPSWIGNLTNLKELYLTINDLTSLPSWIGNLTNLKVLYLDGNELTSLPKEIGNLTNLEDLQLYGNNLTIEDVPPNLRKVTLF